MAALPALLGINLWLTVLVVPLLLAGGRAPLWVWGSIPLLPVLLFAAPRGASAPLRLLCVAPLCALVPGTEIALSPEARTPRTALILYAAALLAYLATQSRALAQLPTPAAAIPEPLATQELPRRWLRRTFIYKVLLLYSIVLPVMLLYAFTLHPRTLFSLRLSFPDPAHLSAVQAAGCAAISLLLLCIFHLCLLAPLRVHLDHDRAVTTEMLALRQLARRGRPRLQFYLALCLSLASMILLAYRSLHP